jgi:hypothetical protein
MQESGDGGAGSRWLCDLAYRRLRGGRLPVNSQANSTQVRHSVPIRCNVGYNTSGVSHIYRGCVNSDACTRTPPETSHALAARRTLA